MLAHLDAPVLPPGVFMDAITASRSDVHARLTSWATAARESIDRRAGELQTRDEEAQNWEIAALGTAVREWRVFEAFRRLHERARCPGLLFRLQTRRGFLTLCDPRADSGPAGYGEHQRRVLSKRGIACRRSWTAARALVAEIGLLDGPEHTDVDATPTDGASSVMPPNELEATTTGAYRDALFSGVPLYTTRLVREHTFSFPTRDQVRSPADAAVVLAEYFRDRDREEFLVIFWIPPTPWLESTWRAWAVWRPASSSRGRCSRPRCSRTRRRCCSRTTTPLATRSRAARMWR